MVGIGGKGIETYRAAVRLGAEEATLRHVPLRLVHGSRPAGQHGSAEPSGMESRQQRGRRLVNGAARDLAATPLGRNVQIRTESSPRTGTDLLLAHGRTALMLVLQRGDGGDLPVGRTTSAVTAAAGCPTLVTRSGRTVGALGVLVVLDVEHDPAPAIALACTEASMRRIAVTVLDGRGDLRAARTAVLAATGDDPETAVRHLEVAQDQWAGRVRRVSRDAVLMVVVRPAEGGAPGLVADAVEDAACPVLMVVPVDSWG